MGMPLPTPTYWTADLVRALPDDGHRYELVHGELLVSPAPRPAHQRVQSRLQAALAAYLAREPVGEVWTAPADYSPGPDLLLQPDLYVVPAATAGARHWADIRDLLLVIELLSPGTARHDRFPKRRAYQEAGVPLYWIVDLEERQVEAWRPADLFPLVERERVEWTPAGATSPCVLDLASLFRDL